MKRLLPRADCGRCGGRGYDFCDILAAEWASRDPGRRHALLCGRCWRELGFPGGYLDGDTQRKSRCVYAALAGRPYRRA